MVRGGRGQIPDDLAEVRLRIEEWRMARSKHGAMPESLWAEALGMAARHGLWRVSRVLRVNYVSLKGRLAEAERGAAETSRDPSPGFVELMGAGAGAWTHLPGAVVELCGPDGARLVIRTPGALGVDVLELAERFWRRQA